MKKALFLGLILISAAMLSIPLAVKRVNGGKEKIVITQEVLSGDPEAAAGVTLRIPSHWDGRLCWDTEYLIGGEGGAKSDFSFLSRQLRWGGTGEKRIGIYFEGGMNDLGAVELAEGVARSRILVPDPLRMDEIIGRTEEEAGGTLTVSIGDYYDFYPVFMWLEGDSVAYEGDYREVIDYLTEYFHISVGEDRWEFAAQKEKDAAEIPRDSWEISEEDQIFMGSASVLGKEGFYFTYDVWDAESGMSVDRGQNRGIFFFPYTTRENTMGQIDLTQVRKLCGLPEELCPQGLLADEEAGELYLAARDSEGYRLFVYRIEAEGLRLAQELAMDPAGQHIGHGSAAAGRTAEQEAPGGAVLMGPAAAEPALVEQAPVELEKMSFCEGGILVTWSDNSFCFLVRDEKGYRIWCQEMFPDPGERTAYETAPFSEENVCAFDGERLVLAAYERRGSLNVVLAVYGQEGQRYGGLYRHSSEGDWDGGFGSPEGISPQGNRSQLLEVDLRE